MNDLEAATTKELVDELARRYPKGLVVAGLRPFPGATDDEMPVVDYRHGLTVGIGLAVRAADILRADGRANMVDAAADEEEEDDL